MPATLKGLDLGNPKLAVNGGKPVRTKKWKDNLTFGKEEQKAASDAVAAGYLSMFEGSFTPDPPMSFRGGPLVQELETRWETLYGVKHAVSMNSATSCLYAAVGALKLGYGDEVIVSPSSMSASSVVPLLYGAIPIFADIERETGALDPASIEKLITPRTKAVIVVHQYGIPADMDRIMALAKKHKFKVIEDCAQSHAAKYKGRYVGTIGDIGVFSLNVNKAIHSGEGGVCTVNDDDLNYRLQLIRNHAEAVVGPAGVADITNLIGFNYRLTEVCAAVAIKQLDRLEHINKTRIGYVQFLNEKLGKLDFLETMPGRKDCVSTFYTWPIIYKDDVGGRSVEDFRKALNAEGMYFLAGYKPLYLQPIYQTKTLFKHGYPWAAKENAPIKTNYAPGSCPVAERMRTQVMIKEYVRLPNTMDDMRDIVATFEKMAATRR
jgi:perosamine synthetase